MGINYSCLFGLVVCIISLVASLIGIRLLAVWIVQTGGIMAGLDCLLLIFALAIIFQPFLD